MSQEFFEHPILNSPYEYPARHWELDAGGQPTKRIVESRRPADFVTPIPKPKKQKGASAPQQGLAFDEHSSAQQQYSHAGIINGVRTEVDKWRTLPDPTTWGVTPETARWATAADRCHINWVVLDSNWEAEFCRIAELHPRVRAYVKNHNLGFEVPYRFQAQMRIYRPDFIVRVDDGHGEQDLLNLVVEIKGYRGEDAKEKKNAMQTYWVPGVNRLGQYGRWAFVELTDVHAMQHDFAQQLDRLMSEVQAA